MPVTYTMDDRGHIRSSDGSPEPTDEDICRALNLSQETYGFRLAELKQELDKAKTLIKVLSADSLTLNSYIVNLENKFIAKELEYLRKIKHLSGEKNEQEIY